MDEEEELQPEEPTEDISPQKLARLKNLKAFKGWSDQEIKDYVLNKAKQEKKVPAPPPRLFEPSEDEGAPFTYNPEEYKRKYDSYYKKYLKEFGVDMNETNDVQALQQFVRLVIQAEVVNENIIRLQADPRFSSKVLKDMGDFQRSIQMSMKELQEQLGISRKTRKEKQVDDIPQYIRQLQLKARDKWARSTQPVLCPRCRIELARYWLNFPSRVMNLNATIVCDKCEETVVFSA